MRPEFQKVQSLIQAGDLRAASAELAAIERSNVVSEQRALGHLKGVIELRLGDIEQAKQTLESTLAAYGENVKLLRDLTVCYFEGRDMQLFRSSQKRLEATLIKQWPHLSFSSRFNVQWTVAKFCEEDGRIAQALHKYRLLLDITERPQASGQRELILAQLVRALALFQPTHNLNSYYNELITIAAQDFTFEIKIEIEHSLMLAELALIGPEHAWIRVQQMIGRAEITEADRRLLYFDFIEGCLSNGLTIPATTKEYLEQFTGLDPYELEIQKMAFSTSGRFDLSAVNNLASKISWSSYVRLLCILAQHQEDEASRLEIQRKVIFMVGSLDEESKTIWRNRLKETFNSQETRLEFSPHKRVLIYSGVTFDLTRKKSMLQLLEALMMMPIVTVDQAIHKIWGSDFSPEHYHRLRMIVHRLNRLVHEGTALGKFIEVDSESVRLKPGIRITDYELSREQMRSAHV